MDVQIGSQMDPLFIKYLETDGTKFVGFDYDTLARIPSPIKCHHCFGKHEFQQCNVFLCRHCGLYHQPYINCRNQKNLTIMQMPIRSMYLSFQSDKKAQQYLGDDQTAKPKNKKAFVSHQTHHWRSPHKNCSRIGHFNFEGSHWKRKKTTKSIKYRC